MNGRRADRVAWRLRLVGLAALAAVPLSGCVALLVGGAAGGGYYVGKDQRSAGRVADDAGITTRINARYARDPAVPARAIDVDTYAGVVTLRGTVPSRAVRARAIAIARSTRGVRRVVSKLEVAPPR